MYLLGITFLLFMLKLSDGKGYCIEETLISDEKMHCGLNHREYYHNQSGNEQKLYTIRLSSN